MILHELRLSFGVSRGLSTCEDELIDIFYISGGKTIPFGCTFIAIHFNVMRLHYKHNTHHRLILWALDFSSNRNYQER